MHICLIAIKVKSGAIWQTIPMIKGPDGDSAYQVALNNGFEGTEAEWLESLSHGPKGDDGAPGTSYQFIFKRTDTAQAPERPVSTTDAVPATWSAVPLGVTVDAKYEWVSVRIKNSDIWTEFSIPGLWAIYGFGDSLPEIYIQDVEGLREALDALELGINDKISKDLLPEEDTLKLPGADAFGVTLPKFLPKATSTSLGAIKLGTTLLMNEDGVTNVKLKMRELDENLTADPADGSVIVWDKPLQKYKNTTLSLTGLYHPLRGTAELDLTAKTLSSINLLIPKGLPTVENNQVALFALENGYSLENPGAGGVSTLDDLNDVALTNVADGHSLFKEGLNFVNKAAYTKAQIDALLLGLNGSYHPLGGSDLLDFRARLLRSKVLYLPTEDFVPPGAGVAIFAKENGYTLIDPETSITEFTDLVDIAALTWLEGQALIYRNNAFINEAIYNKTQVDSLLTNLNMSTYLTKVEALSKYHPKFGFENGNPLDFTADRLKSNTLLIPKISPTLENTEVGIFAVENGYSLSDPQGSAGLLTELDDVLLDAPLNDQALTYSTSLQKWINKTLSFSMFGDSLSADLVSTTETKKFVSNAQILSWNAKWNYNEETIKAVKVNLAADSEKLGGILAGEYWHTGNSNLDTVDWRAKILRSKVLVVPKELPTDLSNNEVAIYALENGYSLEEPGNIGVTSLSALEDVTLTAPLVNNQILAYSLTSQRWVNLLLSFSLFTDQLSADLVLVNDNRRFVTAAQISDWNSRWIYDEDTIKAVKVNAAVDSDKLGGIDAGNYWHQNNSNLYTADWKAKVLRSKTLVVPKEAPIDLALNEVAIYALENGYSLSEPGGGSTVQVLNDLLDVVNTAPQPDDILFYDTTSTAYINGPMTFNKVTGMLDPSRITTGSTARFVTDAQIGFWNAKEDVSNRNQANGYLGLNANTKIDFWFLPDVILGQAKFGGTFNATGIIASDNVDLNGLNLNALTPALYTGYFFIAQADTTVVSIEVQTGDWIISNGAAGWAKVDNTDAVTSVNGRIGAIVLSKSDVGLSNVDNTADANKNVLSATKLFTPRTLWGQSFDGTGNVSGSLSDVNNLTGSGILNMGTILIPKTINPNIPLNTVSISALDNGYSIAEPEAGSVGSLDDLLDVDLIARVDKQLLHYSTLLGKFTNDIIDFSYLQGQLGADRITQSPDYRFVTDAQKLAWNAKQDALDFVTNTEGKYLRDDNTFQTIETLTAEERSHLTSAYNHSIAFGNPHLTKVNELSDAVISGAVTGEVLMYNASTAKWYNAKVDIADVTDLASELSFKQPLNNNLTTISGLNTDGLLRRSGGIWGIDNNSYALASALSNYLGKYETYAMNKYVLEDIPKQTTQVGNFGWTDYQTTPYAGGGFLTLNLGSSLRSLLMIFPDYANNDNIKVLTSIDGAPWGQQKEIAWKDHNHNGTYALLAGSTSQPFSASTITASEGYVINSNLNYEAYNNSDLGGLSIKTHYSLYDFTRIYAFGTYANRVYPDLRFRVGNVMALSIDGYDRAATFTSTVSATSFISGGNAVLHAGNYSSYALPLSGGSLTGMLYMSGANYLSLVGLNYNNIATITGNWGGLGHWGFGSESGHILKFDVVSGQAFLGYSDITLKLGTKTVIDSGNIGSQSVNYANSAGNADTLDSLHAVNFTRSADMINSGNWNTISLTGDNGSFGARVESGTANPPAVGMYNWSLWQQGTSTRGSQLALGAYGGNRMFFRGANLDTGSFRGWAEVWHTDNFNPANYALASSLSNYSLTSHTHSYITSTRYDSGDPKPNQLTVGLSFQFSLPDGGWYNAINMRSYADPNYLATQIVSSANNPGTDTGYSYSLKYREGRNATWSGWKTILDSDNFSSYALPLYGGTLSGGLTLSHGRDLSLKAPEGSSDSGDLIFLDGSGTELHRLWSGSGTLNYRVSGGTARQLYHSGNSNLTSVDWSAKNLTLAGSITGATGSFSGDVSAASFTGLMNLTYLTDENLATQGYNKVGFYRLGNSTATGADGYITSFTWGGGLYTTQIYVDVDPTYNMSIRHRDNGGTWNSWKKIWTEANLTNTLSNGYLPYWNGSSLVNSAITNTTNGLQILQGGSSAEITYQYGSVGMRINSNGSPVSIYSGWNSWIMLNTGYSGYENGLVYIPYGKLGIGYTDRPEKLAVNGSGYFNSTLAALGRLESYGGYGLTGGGSYTSYTPDGLWGATATPNFIGHTIGAKIRIGYQDNGSGLYGFAYGFDVKHTDGLSNNIAYPAIIMRDMEDGSNPFYITNKGAGYFASYIESASYLKGSSLFISGNAGANTPIATFTQNSQATFNWGQLTLAPNMTTNTHVINLIGVAGSARNSVYMGFTYVGSGSYSNKITFGFHSNDHLLTISPYGAAIFSGSASSVTAPAFYHSSDMTLKNVISPLESSLDKLRNMSTFYYTLKDDSSQRIQLGMSAQEFDTYFPTLVGRDSNDKLQLEYPRISVLAVKAIQEIDKIQKDHDRRIEELEIEVKTLKQKLNATSN